MVVRGDRLLVATPDRKKKKKKPEDESSSGGEEDEGDESRAMAGDGEEQAIGGVGLCAADEPFACQSVACGAGGDGGPGCMEQ